MGTIFSGMDPYLEDAWSWSGFHARFIVYLAETLQPPVRPRYAKGIEQRVFVEGHDLTIIPDVRLLRDRPEAWAAAIGVIERDAPVEVVVPALEIRETCVTLGDLRSDNQVITVIELVSPTNKYDGPGRRSYQEKQAEVLASDAHLVEIDLLRRGPHVLAVAEWAARSKGDDDDLVSVNRAEGDRSRHQLDSRTLRQRLPRVRIPLAREDPDATLDLQAVLSMTYDRGGYGEDLAYDRPCVPPLPPEDQAWADELIRDGLANRT